MLHRFNRQLRFPNIRHAAQAIQAAQAETPEKRLGTLTTLRERVEEVFRGVAHGDWTYHADRALGFMLPALALGVVTAGLAIAGSLGAFVAGAASAPFAIVAASHAWRSAMHVFTLLDDIVVLQRKIDHDIEGTVSAAPELAASPAYLTMRKDLRPAFNDRAYDQLVARAGSGPSFETPPPPRRTPQHIQKA